MDIGMNFVQEPSLGRVLSHYWDMELLIKHQKTLKGIGSGQARLLSETINHPTKMVPEKW